MVNPEARPSIQQHNKEMHALLTGKTSHHHISRTAQAPEQKIRTHFKMLPHKINSYYASMTRRTETFFLKGHTNRSIEVKDLDIYYYYLLLFRLFHMFLPAGFQLFI